RGRREVPLPRARRQPGLRGSPAEGGSAHRPVRRGLPGVAVPPPHRPLRGRPSVLARRDRARTWRTTTSRAPRIEAAVFADVSGFTALSERSGDRAADVALTLAEVAAEVAARHGGEVVEMLGDGVLLHVGDPSGAVMAALEIVAGAEARGLPP